MAKFYVQATVNYPDHTDVPTPAFEGYPDETAVWVLRLMASEPEATSYVVTIVRLPEPEA